MLDIVKWYSMFRSVEAQDFRDTGFSDSKSLLDWTQTKREESTYGDSYVPCEICADAFCRKEVGLPVAGRWLGGQAAYAV